MTTKGSEALAPANPTRQKVVIEAVEEVKVMTAVDVDGSESLAERVKRRRRVATRTR